ncbi:hypothetical protein D5I63_25835 [Escherichia coli]|nr:hypothetical protein [Escherichia coli]
MTSLKTSIKTITYLSDTGCLEIQGASLLSCNALWQKCVLATLYRAAATHPEIKLLQFKLIVSVNGAPY